MLNHLGHQSLQASRTRESFHVKYYKWNKERNLPSSIEKIIFTWETTLSITPPESPEAPRAGARESSSSKKITHGRADLAWKACMVLQIVHWRKILKSVIVNPHPPPPPPKQKKAREILLKTRRIFYLLENVSNILLWLSNVHVDQLRSFYAEKV